MAIYRVLQEALTNGYRHAGVEEQWVRLRGMHHRVRLLGGTYCRVSAPGQGTLVSVAVPAAISAEGR